MDKKNNKKRKRIIIVAVVLIVIIVSPVIVIKSIFGFKPDDASWLNVRTYQGNRITVNLYVTVDGEPAKLIKNGIGYNLKNNDGSQTLADRANDYNTYEYSLKINSGKGKSIPLNITVNHWNWWEIVESDLYIDIDTKSNSYKTHETYRYTAEYPIYHYETESEPEQTIEGIESIEISAGCKG